MFRNARVLVVIAAAATLHAAAQDAAESRPQKDDSATPKPILCPVTAKPIDWDCVTLFRGRWVYCADADALRKFEADPYEYADGVAAQWEVNQPLRIQVKCPVTGELPAPDIYVGKGEDAVFFATEDARSKWLADSRHYKQRLEKECYTFQTLCVVSAAPIDPKVSLTVGERTVYFRCPHCRGSFDPKDADKLKAFDEQVQRNRTAWLKRQAERRRAQATTQPASR